MNKLDHLPHLEDLIFQMGPKEFVGYVSDIELAHKTADTALTIKYDGSPSLVAGIDSTDNRFFVATKGFFNKTPVMYKSQDDIDKIANPGLAHVMSHAFAKLKDHPFCGCILQGDVMWCPGSVTEHAQGAFSKTNVLSYKKEVNSDLGIVWHTVYDKSGEAFAAGTTEFWAVLNRLFHHGFVYGSTVWHGTPTLPATPTRVVNLDVLLNRIRHAADQITALHDGPDDHEREYWKTHFPNIRDPEVLKQDYARSVHQAYEKEKAKFKTQKKHDELNLAVFDALRHAARDNHFRMASYFHLYWLVLEYKRQRLYGYEHSGRLKPYTYDVETDVYLPAAIEGLVYRPNDGVACKLVDRDYFTRLNQTSPYSKQSRSNT